MKNKKLLMVFTHLLTALLAVAITLGAVVIVSVMNPNKLATLEALIEEMFIGEVNKTVIEDAAADAMVNALGDRWSYYIPASQYGAYLEQMNNAYVGIGVTIALREDGTGLDVEAITPGGPAEEAGLQVGDIVTAADGKSFAGLTLEEMKTHIQGEANTKVVLTVLRDSKELSISVTRKQIQVPVATATMLEGNIGLVTIENFDARCADETLAAVEQLLSQGAQKLIFDVRFNPGGYVTELVRVLDYLVPEGLIFRSEYYNGETEEEYSDAKELDVPMAVLVNGDSYSAAEFFAVALRDYDKAVIVGQQTCGKGYFQSVFPLGDGSAVGLSIGKYYTPKGENLAGVGVTPDVTVEVTEEMYADIYYGTVKPEEDPQIQAAIKALNR